MWHCSALQNSANSYSSLLIEIVCLVFLPVLSWYLEVKMGIQGKCFKMLLCFRPGMRSGSSMIFMALAVADRTPPTLYFEKPQN